MAEVIVINVPAEQGLPGPQGPKGDKGDIGDTGPQGPKGDNGELVGPKGDTGDIGPQGPQGLQGPQGEIGPQGIQGEVGPQGPKGDTGDVGPQGEQGVQGIPGVKGDTGDIGPQGIQGETGPQGIQGLKGDTGDVGPVGPQGEQGPAGAKGDAGLNGATVGFTTKAAMDANLAYAANIVAFVTNDTTAANNGYYIKLGASGAGSWQKATYDPISKSVVNNSHLASNFYITDVNLEGQGRYFQRTSINLIRPEDIQMGYKFDTGGAIVADAQHAITGFIPCTPETDYARNRGNIFHEWMFFDANKNLVRDVGVDSTVTAQTGEAFFRCTLWANLINISDMIVQQSAPVTENYWVPYHQYRLLASMLPSQISASDGVDVEATRIKPGITIPNQQKDLTAILNRTSPLKFDDSKVMKGTLNSSGVATLDAGSIWYITDYEPVTPGEKFTVGSGVDGVTNMYYYDSNKVFISTTNCADGVHVRIVPANAAYVRFQLGGSRMYNPGYMIVSGETQLQGWVPYNTYKIPQTIIKSKWNRKKCAVIGDSITGGNGERTDENNQCTLWMYHVQKQVQFDVVDQKGVSASTVTSPSAFQPMVERYQNLIANADLILFMGGTNDCTQAKTIGDINSTDPTVFLGALNIIFKGLRTTYPNAKIGVLTPTPYGDHYASLKTYVEAIKLAAERWSLPVLDLFASVGFSADIPSDLTAYYVQDGLKAHPNDTGHQIIADKVLKFIETL